ncbi:DUF4230 domain-containing protein [Hyalangium rubrum]|uniref:DUF4230 domain-containing protein n=1 Tax=Hyalangium rubrum TaxID=3103134 RepID=A0ABU5HGT1_9BACT|nr:DUF4230 domain-containing protein [Hyalangium sp. s54d21]MDY7232667.1 DUF4230 domain-containing protein [Hyalangium sp. s54d21]
MRLILRILPVVLAAVLGAVGAFVALRPSPKLLPDPPALVLQMREVTRLETLDVSLYKKVSFSPEPTASDALWKDVIHWAAYSLRTPRGRAIVFADVHLGYDFQRVDTSSLRVTGTRVEVVLPPLEVKVELRPGETEIIDSNLDSAQTAQLLERARLAFEKEVRGDVRLQQRARQSAERSLRGLFLSLGFNEVRFVDQLTQASAG